MIDWLRRSFAPIDEPPTRARDQFDLAARRARLERLERQASLRTQARAIDSFTNYPGLEAQMLAVQGLNDRPWRAAGINEALGVPAILGAVTLISKTVGSMTMEAFVGGVEVPPEQRPRLIVRPDPFRSSSAFYGPTAYNMAVLGEAWWWVAKRDFDGLAISILNINPAEVTVEENPRNLLRPIIRWRNVIMPNEDMIQIPYILPPGSLRGVGPLQICQAAVSVAVESQEWAANFYADGGGTPTIVYTPLDLQGDPDDPETTDSEAVRFADAWNAKGNNRPRVVSENVVSKVEQLDYNPNGAQMLDARTHQIGDAARMFSMPGTLLDYAVGGSSLVYQTLASQYDDFLRRCLRPNYLTPIEQAMTDLVARTTVCHFDTDILTLADVKTRYEAYQIGIDTGIISVEKAQEFEGITGGDTDNAPVPFSPPSAVPDLLPIQGRAGPQASPQPVRCDGTRMLRGLMKPCNAKLAEAGPFTGTCWRCRKVHVAVA
jgi:HK97 family phage portal protein